MNLQTAGYFTVLCFGQFYNFDLSSLSKNQVFKAVT